MHTYSKLYLTLTLHVSITSDFGLDPDSGIHDMPVFGRKKVSYEAVTKQAAENHLTLYPGSL